MMNKNEVIEKSAYILTKLYKKPINFSLYFDRKIKCAGMANSVEKYIVLNNAAIYDDTVLVTLLLHEYGHLKLKHNPRSKNRLQKEFEAERYMLKQIKRIDKNLHENYKIKMYNDREYYKNKYPLYYKAWKPLYNW